MASFPAYFRMILLPPKEVFTDCAPELLSKRTWVVIEKVRHVVDMAVNDDPATFPRVMLSHFLGVHMC